MHNLRVLELLLISMTVVIQELFFKRSSNLYWIPMLCKQCYTHLYISQYCKRGFFLSKDLFMWKKFGKKNFIVETGIKCPNNFINEGKKEFSIRR